MYTNIWDGPSVNAIVRIEKPTSLTGGKLRRHRGTMHPHAVWDLVRRNHWPETTASQLHHEWYWDRRNPYRKTPSQLVPHWMDTPCKLICPFFVARGAGNPKTQENVIAARCGRRWIDPPFVYSGDVGPAACSRRDLSFSLSFWVT